MRTETPPSPTRPQRGGTLPRATSSAPGFLSAPSQLSTTWAAIGVPGVYRNPAPESSQPSPPPHLLSLLSPFPGAHAQPEPRAHISGLAGARVCRVQRPVMDVGFTINPLNPASLICLPTAPTVDFEQSFSSFSCNSPAANSAFCLPAFLTFSTTE